MAASNASHRASPVGAGSSWNRSGCRSTGSQRYSSRNSQTYFHLVRTSAWARR
jgi:hypothetical protein